LDKLDIEYQWEEDDTDEGNQEFMKNYYRGRYYEYDYFVRLGTLDNKRKFLDMWIKL
jgi:hypothetical protein